MENFKNFICEHWLAIILFVVLIYLPIWVNQKFKKHSDIKLDDFEWIIVFIINGLTIFLSFISQTDIIIVVTLNIVITSFMVLWTAAIKLMNISNHIEVELSTIKKYISHNPVFTSKDSHKQLVENLPSVCAKDCVLTFFKDTFKQVETKGLINIDTTMIDYTNKLKDIAGGAKHSIIGTYTNRPLETYEHRNDSLIKEYNETLKRMATSENVNIIRIVVLSDLEIQKIQAGNKNLVCEVENSSSKINEIEWFEKCWNTEKITVLWTSENKFKEFFSFHANLSDLVLFAGQKIADFAIFDEKLYVTWRKYDTRNIKQLSQEYGNMILNWNNLINDLSITFTENNLLSGHYVFDSFEKLYSSMPQKQNGKKSGKTNN